MPFDRTSFEKNTVMNPTAVSRTEGSARTAVREQADLQESRLWDRARLNLMLLYGGQRGGSNGQGNASGVATSPFGNGVVEI
jgi:hypothetical protein